MRRGREGAGRGADGKQVWVGLRVVRATATGKTWICMRHVSITSLIDCRLLVRQCDCRVGKLCMLQGHQHTDHIRFCSIGSPASAAGALH